MDLNCPCPTNEETEAPGGETTSPHSLTRGGAGLPCPSHPPRCARWYCPPLGAGAVHGIRITPSLSPCYVGRVLLGIELCLPKSHMLKCSTLQNVTLYGHGVIADTISYIKMSSLGRTLIRSDWYPYLKKTLGHRKGHILRDNTCDGEGTGLSEPRSA